MAGDAAGRALGSGTGADVGAATGAVADAAGTGTPPEPGESGSVPEPGEPAGPEAGPGRSVPEGWGALLLAETGEGRYHVAAGAAGGWHRRKAPRNGRPVSARNAGQAASPERAWAPSGKAAPLPAGFRAEVAARPKTTAGGRPVPNPGGPLAAPGRDAVRPFLRDGRGVADNRGGHGVRPGALPEGGGRGGRGRGMGELEAVRVGRGREPAGADTGERGAGAPSGDAGPAARGGGEAPGAGDGGQEPQRPGTAVADAGADRATGRGARPGARTGGAEGTRAEAGAEGGGEQGGQGAGRPGDRDVADGDREAREGEPDTAGEEEAGEEKTEAAEDDCRARPSTGTEAGDPGRGRRRTGRRETVSVEEDDAEDEPARRLAANDPDRAAGEAGEEEPAPGPATAVRRRRGGGAGDAGRIADGLRAERERAIDAAGGDGETRRLRKEMLRELPVNTDAGDTGALVERYASALARETGSLADAKAYAGRLFAVARREDFEGDVLNGRSRLAAAFYMLVHSKAADVAGAWACLEAADLYAEATAQAKRNLEAWLAGAREFRTETPANIIRNAAQTGARRAVTDMTGLTTRMQNALSRFASFHGFLRRNLTEGQ
ncbi:MAG: hypothetical protein LBG06_04180, partial [Deltaproteobacteria bacterium]|nr:hypothetical protein [Deltaproteobacteria bacterium]